MRLTTANKELKATCLFFLISHLKLSCICSFYFSFSPASSCRILAQCFVQITCQVLMCLLHLLKFPTSWGTLNSVGPEWLEVVVVGSWEEQAGLAAFLGRGSCRLCTSLCAGQRGHARAVHWEEPCGMTRACADADRSQHLQDLLMLNIACDLEKFCFQFSIISRTSTHAVPILSVALQIWCPSGISSVKATDG